MSRVRSAGASPGPAPAPRPAASAVRRPAASLPAAPDRDTRLLTWLAAAGIGGSIVIMVAASVARHSVPVPLLPRPAGPLPVELPLRLPEPLVTFGLWTAAVLGGGGVIAGLAAVARGARYPAWLLLAGGLVAVAAFTVLPPAGSTDALSYATFGRMAALGHNPYVMTPNQLARTGDPIGRLAIQLWRGSGSLYGPLATLEQRAAPHLGG